MLTRLRKNSAKVPNGRRNRLPHHGRSSSCSEVGQAVSPVGSLFPQPVTHGGSTEPRPSASPRRRTSKSLPEGRVQPIMAALQETICLRDTTSGRSRSFLKLHCWRKTAPGGRRSISAISQILRFWSRDLRERSTPMLLKSPGRPTRIASDKWSGISLDSRGNLSAAREVRAWFRPAIHKARG
jgi:hypothetical protein